MTDQVSAPRSRRALLTAAAGGAAALAASAALPLSVAAADPDDVVRNEDNPTTATTSITNSTDDSTAFAASAAGVGYAIEASSESGAALVAWTVSPPPFLDPENIAGIGVLGSAPAGFANVGIGVVGESEDWGILGIGSVGVLGFGDFGVVGESFSDNAGVTAAGSGPSALALDVYGKVRFSRSGRANVRRGRASKTVNLAGVTSKSHVLAVVHSNRGGRWVRAVVPTSGKFKIYLNGPVALRTSVAWFVIN